MRRFGVPIVLAILAIGCERYKYTERRIGAISEPVRVDRYTGKTEILRREGGRDHWVAVETPADERAREAREVEAMTARRAQEAQEQTQRVTAAVAAAEHERHCVVQPLPQDALALVGVEDYQGKDGVCTLSLQNQSDWSVDRAVMKVTFVAGPGQGARREDGGVVWFTDAVGPGMRSMHINARERGKAQSNLPGFPDWAKLYTLELTGAAGTPPDCH